MRDPPGSSRCIPMRGGEGGSRVRVRGHEAVEAEARGVCFEDGRRGHKPRAAGSP